MALKYGNKVFASQQDGHIHQRTEQWCQDHFPSLIDNDRWPPKSPDLNPLDYSIWNELAELMDWNKITSKRTLIDELKKAPNKVRAKVIISR